MVSHMKEIGVTIHNRSSEGLQPANQDLWLWSASATRRLPLDIVYSISWGGSLQLLKEYIKKKRSPRSTPMGRMILKKKTDSHNLRHLFSVTILYILRWTFVYLCPGDRIRGRPWVVMIGDRLVTNLKVNPCQSVSDGLQSMGSNLHVEGNTR